MFLMVVGMLFGLLLLTYAVVWVVFRLLGGYDDE
jgi:hypothetical protein